MGVASGEWKVEFPAGGCVWSGNAKLTIFTKQYANRTFKFWTRTRAGSRARTRASTGQENQTGALNEFQYDKPLVVELANWN